MHVGSAVHRAAHFCTVLEADSHGSSPFEHISFLPLHAVSVIFLYPASAAHGRLNSSSSSHAVHLVLLAPEHRVLAYLPPLHVLHVLHTVSVVLVQAALIYSPAEHVLDLGQPVHL